jgi:hypothetical protein
MLVTEDLSILKIVAVVEVEGGVPFRITGGCYDKID